MTIVDLRGRERVPEVLALLDPGPTWNVVGWERDHRLVACAGIERTSDDELTIRALGAHADCDALALLDAIARVATALRIVAEATDESAELYRSGGFVLEHTGDGRIRAVRMLDEQAAPPASIRATTLEETQAAIRAAWGPDTSDDPEEWSELNPARGQCAVTALLVHELLGGEILVANVLRDGRRVDRHAWNRLPLRARARPHERAIRQRRAPRRAVTGRAAANSPVPRAARNAARARAGPPRAGLRASYAASGSMRSSSRSSK